MSVSFYKFTLADHTDSNTWHVVQKGPHSMTPRLIQELTLPATATSVAAAHHVVEALLESGAAVMRPSVAKSKWRIEYHGVQPADSLWDLVIQRLSGDIPPAPLPAPLPDGSSGKYHFRVSHSPLTLQLHWCVSNAWVDLGRAIIPKMLLNSVDSTTLPADIGSVASDALTTIGTVHSTALPNGCTITFTTSQLPPAVIQHLIASISGIPAMATLLGNLSTLD